MNDTNCKIRAWMGANKVSGYELAEKIGMPYPTFRSKMGEISDWKLSEVRKLIEVTGLTFDELF